MPRSTYSTRARLAAPLAAGLALAGARAGLAQPATPTPAAPNAFGGLLDLTPATLATGAQLALFADIAAQLAAFGTPAPASVEAADLDAWFRALTPLGIAQPFAERALLLTRDLIGFDLTDIDQTLEAGEPPAVATLLRGRFDRSAVAAAWSANGYELLDVDGVQVASLSPEPRIDLDSQIGKLALARMNNAAFLADGTLAYTPSLDGMRAILTAAGGSGALGRRVDVATLLGTLEAPLASGVLFPGSVLAANAQLPPNLSDSTAVAGLLATAAAAAKAMPPVALGIMGMTPGGPVGSPEDATPVPEPSGTIVIQLLLAEPGTAERAKTTIETRFADYVSAATGQPLAPRFADVSVRALADANVVAMELTPGDISIGAWSRLFFQRDLLFLAW